MLDKDKLFIVVYVGVHGFGDQTVSEILANVAKRMQYDDSVNTLIIPTRDSETRVECINPKLVSEEEFEKAHQACEKITEKLKELMKDES